MFFTTLLFVELITNSFDSGIFNPWTAHTLSGGDSLAFPYGIVMYMAYAPLTFLGYNLDNILSTTFFANVGFSFSSLLFDYLLLLAIALLSRGFSTRIILISYWSSPLVIYILYWHGQLDVLPVFLLLLALIFLQRSYFVAAAFVFAFAISAKFSMLAAVPFVIVYMYRNIRLRLRLLRFICTLLAAIFLTTFPFLFSESFQHMVLIPPVASRMFSVSLIYGDNLKLYLLPAIYIFALYLTWRLDKVTFDLFIITIGVGFFSVLLLLPPSPGWFLWSVPFIVFYQLKSRGDYLFIIIPYFLLLLFYNILYSTGATIPFLSISFVAPLKLSSPFSYPLLQSFLFTLLQATGFLVCYRMFYYGIARNSYYRRGRRPLIVGIVGDLGFESDFLFTRLRSLLGSENISRIRCDDYLKWDSGNPMFTVSSVFNPRSTNLSRLASDVYSLADGKVISSSQYSESSDSSALTTNISPSNILFVTGLHCFHLTRLRQRIDLKIFINCDEDLRFYFHSKSSRTYPLSPAQPSTKELSERKLFIDPQAHYADLVFNLSRVNPEIPLPDYDTDLIPRLKLHVKLRNGFFHESLVHHLIALCSVHIETEQTADFEFVSLSIDGEISSEDIEQVATLLIPNLSDLVVDNLTWQSGSFGLMQLVTLVHLSDLLHSNIAHNHV